MDSIWQIRVRGRVQGVGFRPHVWRIATALGLPGDVLNDHEGVLIRVPHWIDAHQFEARLRSEAPPLARIDALEWTAAKASLTTDFQIAASGPQGAETRVSPDAATCADCIAEIFGDGRRQGYAFTNCTNCGPRFTILNGLPYDRSQTTMAAFTMCNNCRAEYDDPADRRFHAQPIACPDCGPQLWLEVDGLRQPGDALCDATHRLRSGQIVAVKGLGGFHLACDAADADAVARLRARKHRPTKPLAVMIRAETLNDFVDATDAQIDTLRDSAAVIVLVARKPGVLADGLAPGLDELGVMLPYTPLHHLLLAQTGPLVMTSANESGMPQVIDNAAARGDLAGIADAILMHDRTIARRLDDSVERVTALGATILRRGRGRVPDTLPLPPGFEHSPDVVAYGALLKSAICLTKNGQALLSHHLGDLDTLETRAEFEKANADYAALFDHKPVAAVRDLHPDYASSRFADAGHLPVIEVQHHHAHLAACLAENSWPRDGGPVAGIVLDGLGLGPDGTIWGGELLLGDYAQAHRSSWLEPVPLPGGDAANREPWRNLLAQLDRAGLSSVADALMPEKPRDLLRQAAASGLNAPLSASAGRLFDAFAAAAGFGPERQSYEGEAAILLEVAARRCTADVAPYPFGSGGTSGQIDTAPLWHAWWQDREEGRDPGEMARRFHLGLAQVFAVRSRALVQAGQARAVALSGGCFQNALLLELCLDALGDTPVMVHRQVPPNDGGLALGQAVVALAQLESN